jgi:hypothetical protein
MIKNLKSLASVGIVLLLWHLKTKSQAGDAQLDEKFPEEFAYKRHRVVESPFLY